MHLAKAPAREKHRLPAKPKARRVGRKSPVSDDRSGFVIKAFMDRRGTIIVERVTKSFRMSKGELAKSVGLAPEAVYKASRVKAVKTQSRIREMLEIINRVANWAGGKDQAMAWYRAEPIPALGDRTAESLVKSGEAAIVRDYLDVIGTGGFA